MSPVMLVVVIVAVALVATAGWYAWQRRRTEELRARYGPEYERTLSEAGDRRRGEAELVRRQERVEQLQIRALSADQRRGYLEEWRAVQTRFVDDPRGAVTEADGLVEDVMRARGYPVSDFDQRAADLSVHHPRVVNNYRAARDIALRHRRGEANTEDLRQAMVYYRELFEDLLEDREGAAAKRSEREIERARDTSEARRADRAVELPVDRDDARVDRTDREVRERPINPDREVNP